MLRLILPTFDDGVEAGHEASHIAAQGLLLELLLEGAVAGRLPHEVAASEPKLALESIDRLRLVARDGNQFGLREMLVTRKGKKW